jgi:hypothetical protein
MSDKQLYKKVVPKSEKFGGNITFLIKPGEIGRILGKEEILKFVSHLMLERTKY